VAKEKKNEIKVCPFLKHYALKTYGGGGMDRNIEAF
jgi:hypothetical protein